jgi:hypothetical protein
MFMKRGGLTRAAAVDRVILSPEVSRAHRQEREETERELRLHDRVSKDAIKTADEAIDALAEQHRTRHPGMTHAQCVEYVITATEEGKRFYERAGRNACARRRGLPDHGESLVEAK